MPATPHNPHREVSTMLKRSVLCRCLTYQAASAGAERIIIVPEGTTLYTCRQCRETCMVDNESLLYRSLLEISAGKTCPTCQTAFGKPARKYLKKVALPEQAWLERDGATVTDEQMRREGYERVSVTDNIYTAYFDLDS
jgi:hypothetical protein